MSALLASLASAVQKVEPRVVLKNDAVMEPPCAATHEDLKKINTVFGSMHAGITGVLSFEPGPRRKVR